MSVSIVCGSIKGRVCVPGFAGTPGYLSPEVLRKDPYGKPVDMWACGETPVLSSLLYVTHRRAAFAALSFWINHGWLSLHTFLIGQATWTGDVKHPRFVKRTVTHTLFLTHLCWLTQSTQQQQAAVVCLIYFWQPVSPSKKHFLP